MDGLVRFVPLLVLAIAATPAAAQERDFCANRPGLGTPPCTLAPGTAMLETGIAEWDHSATAAASEDDETFGDLLVRFGVSDSAEVQLGITSFSRDRVRDAAGDVDTIKSDFANAFIGVRRGLAGPNGPVAVEAFAAVPPSHLSRWSAGILLPAGVDLPEGFQLAVTPEVDIAADADDRGRHLAYGGVVGLSHALGANFSIAGELAAFEGNDPAGHALDARLAGSLAWQVSPRLQLDFEADVGLSADAPDTAIMIGFANRFR